MSTINVTNLSGRGGATPNLPDGANITGVATATTFSGTLDGSLKTTGTPTLGLGVTINSSGLVVSGVATAGVGSFTTVYGDGSNLTGVGESVAPWYYNPDINDTAVTVGTGIGFTFNKKIVAGSGTATLKIVNAGTAGTTIQSWGISSFTQPTVDSLTFGSLVSDLLINQTYQLDIPSGFVKDSGDTDYVGTAYTFTVEGAFNKLWVTGRGVYGQTAQNSEATYSSPIQVPSPVSWKAGWGKGELDDSYTAAAVKTDGTLWTWGNNQLGNLGHGDRILRSSPTQIPGNTWSEVSVSVAAAVALKTDGTLWTWGGNAENGQLGHNNRTNYSSPVQVGSDTTWAWTTGPEQFAMATKTDGTLWAWGNNSYGALGLNQAHEAKYSSPVQIPGTTWTIKEFANMSSSGAFALKTDGTAWGWGYNNKGQLGQNNRTNYSSPVQVTGTQWGRIDGGGSYQITLLKEV